MVDCASLLLVFVVNLVCCFGGGLISFFVFLLMFAVLFGVFVCVLVVI